MSKQLEGNETAGLTANSGEVRHLRSFLSSYVGHDGEILQLPGSRKSFKGIQRAFPEKK